MSLFNGFKRHPKAPTPEATQAHRAGSKRDNFRLVSVFAAKLLDENISVKHENTSLKKQLGTVTEERDDLALEKTVHEESRPNGCVDTRLAPAPAVLCSDPTGRHPGMICSPAFCCVTVPGSSERQPRPDDDA